MSEEIKETAGGELTQGNFKIKKPKKLTDKDPVSKIDLSNKKEENKTEETTKVEIKSEETPIVEVVEEKTEEKEVVAKEKELPKVEYKVPEHLEKLNNFLQETGGTIDDYSRLNTDYSTVDDKILLKEYYKSTKPHLDSEEIDFIMEDNFHYDEDVDEERDIRKKKLAYKEELAEARNFLEETKSKYYEEIKLKPSVTQEQQKAVDFFNRHNEQLQKISKQQEKFIENTENYFSKDFKGFEFNLGEKKFKYNVNNADKIAKDQVELQSFVRTFLNEDGSIEDYENYHKALYAAKNADSIAKHFYEQGKADGVKNIVNKSKNIDASSRPQNSGDMFINGYKVKAISGVDSSKLKIKSKK